MQKGAIIVVSAPSGAGKSTLINMVRERIPNLVISVSATTRSARPGEVEGRDYYFISRQAFQEGIEKGLFAEWAEVHGNYYGTYNSEIARCVESGNIALLELDVQGMRSIKKHYPDMRSIFIAPPSLEELEQRLVLRGVNEAQDMAVRLANAAVEMAASHEFDHVVVNDKVDLAAETLARLIETLAHH